MAQPIIVAVAASAATPAARSLAKFLRSRWVISSGVTAGGIALLGAWWLSGDTKVFFAGLLIEAGAALLLLVPLIALERSMDDRVAANERRTDRIEENVSEVLGALADLSPERISEEVINRINSRRERDLTKLTELQDSPTAPRVYAALSRCAELGCVSKNGLRVRFPHTDFTMRFKVPDPGNERWLEVHLEEWGGELIYPFRWSFDAEPADFGAEVAQSLMDRGRYPGDVPFQGFGEFLAKVGEHLMLSFVKQSGVTGFADTLWPLIEVFEPQWAITDLGIEQIDNRHSTYQITADRLDDLDWDPHVTEKKWVDASSFRMALDVARSLRARGEWNEMTWYQNELRRKASGEAPL